MKPPAYHPGRGGGPKVKFRPDLAPFWQSDSSLPTEDNHEAHLRMIRRATGGYGFPVLRAS